MKEETLLNKSKKEKKSNPRVILLTKLLFRTWNLRVQLEKKVSWVIFKQAPTSTWAFNEWTKSFEKIFILKKTYNIETSVKSPLLPGGPHYGVSTIAPVGQYVFGPQKCSVAVLFLRQKFVVLAFFFYATLCYRDKKQLTSMLV
jgi:hypothetical protein